MVAAWTRSADERDILRDRERRAVVEDDHRDLLGGGVARPNGTVGVVDEQMMFGSRTSPISVGDVAAAAALHVIGVDRPAGDRRDRVLELGALVQAVGVERDGDVVGVGEPQRVIDQRRVGAVVLVDLEAARARVQQGGQAIRRPRPARTPAGRCSAASRRVAASVRSIAQGGSSKPAVMSVVTPPDSAAGSSSGEMRWTWLSTAPGVAIRP